MNDSRSERTARGWPAVVAVSVALVLVVASVHVADASLLDMEAAKPGFRSTLRTMLFSGLAVLWGGFGALVLARRFGGSRALLVLFLAVAVASATASRLTPSTHRDTGLEILQADLDIDPQVWTRAAFALGRRVAFRVPESGRVAIVHPTVQHDFPLFLAYSLCPRVFFAFAEEEPSSEVVRELGIGWILDVRRTSADEEYRRAVLRRVKP